MKKLFASILLCLAFTASAFAAGKYDLSINGRKVLATDSNEFSFILTHEAVPFQVCLKGEYESVDVSPHSRKVKSEKKAGETSFSIEKKGYYIVTLDGEDKLFIFAEDAISTPQGKSVLSFKGIKADGKTNITGSLQKAVDASCGQTLVFPEGVYLTSGLRIPSNSDIFLEEGAVIKADPGKIDYEQGRTRGFVEIIDADNVSLRGQGMIDGSGDLVKPKARSRRNLHVQNSSNVRVEDLLSFNSASWNTHFLWCDNVSVSHYKIMSYWNLKNTDGFDPDCCRNLRIKDCFAHCSDDCVAIKTTDRLGKSRNLENVSISGCVFETRKSALKVGTETTAEEMHHIIFENNDVVESDRGMSLYIKDGTTIHDVIYRNNRFERNHPDVCRYPFHFYVHKRTPESKVGAMYNIVVENCIYEQSWPNLPCFENPHDARMEFILRNVELPIIAPTSKRVTMF